MTNHHHEGKNMTTTRYCDMDGETYDAHGNERYWHCAEPSVGRTATAAFCEDHRDDILTCQWCKGTGHYEGWWPSHIPHATGAVEIRHVGVCPVCDGRGEFHEITEEVDA